MTTVLYVPWMTDKPAKYFLDFADRLRADAKRAVPEDADAMLREAAWCEKQAEERFIRHTSDALVAAFGSGWAICRDTPANRARYKRCITQKQYREALHAAIRSGTWEGRKTEAAA